MCKEKYDLLIVDDDSIRLEPFVDFLQDASFNVFHANSPKEAWTFLKNEENRFKLIVLDLIIPTRGAYSRNQCKNAEDCGKTFLLDLRDKEFINEMISDEEHEIRLEIKKKYQNIPVVIFTARNIEKFGLSNKLTKEPYIATRVDSKKVFDFEGYANDLYEIAKGYENG